ncbi:MAG: isoprenyl transferase [bacterium]|nr:isoprenyl transferase [bacterium]
MQAIDPDKIPGHIALILDGNGRWAQSRGLPREAGHRRGPEVVKETVRSARDLGVKMLTMFAFSTENWNRPPGEVEAIMTVFDHYLKDDPEELMKNGIRVQAIGRREMLAPQIQDAIAKLEDQTEKNEQMRLTFALSYSGRTELVDAARKIARKVKTGSLDPEAIDEKCIEQHLYAPDLAPPDLLIRTGGEYRISNFLLWELAYTELYVTETLWPDFKKDDLEEAICAYQQRERRFGRTGEQIRTQE